MAHPIVYGPPASPYVWAARLALAEKGVTHELVPVALAQIREEPHLSRHPFARVPAFAHDDFALYETQAIVRYIDERFAGTPLQPEDVFEWSRMNQLIGIVDAYAFPAMAVVMWNRVLLPRYHGGTPDEAAIEKALPRARLCLGEFERLMDDNEFLAGPAISLADVMAAPLVYNFSRLPDGAGLVAERPKLQAWLHRIEARQSFQVTKPDPL
jgi:glutathione S-transferase